MKAVVLILALLAAGVSEAEKQDIRLTGWVSDESCGALHTKPGGEDCIQKCIKGAEHMNPEWTPQRMVFVVDDDHAIWFVENPDALKGYEGKHLTVSGTLDSEKKSVYVTDKERVREEP